MRVSLLPKRNGPAGAAEKIVAQVKKALADAQAEVAQLEASEAQSALDAALDLPGAQAAYDKLIKALDAGRAKVRTLTTALAKAESDLEEERRKHFLARRKQEVDDAKEAMGALLPLAEKVTERTGELFVAFKELYDATDKVAEQLVRVTGNAMDDINKNGLAFRGSAIFPLVSGELYRLTCSSAAAKGRKYPTLAGKPPSLMATDWPESIPPLAAELRKIFDAIKSYIDGEPQARPPVVPQLQDGHSTQRVPEPPKPATPAPELRTGHSAQRTPTLELRSGHSPHGPQE